MDFMMRNNHITGGDVEAQKTLRFDPEHKTVVVEDRALRPRPD